MEVVVLLEILMVLLILVVLEEVVEQIDHLELQAQLHNLLNQVIQEHLVLVTLEVLTLELLVNRVEQLQVVVEQAE